MSTVPQVGEILKDADAVTQAMDTYSDFYQQNEEHDVEKRKNNSKDIVSTFYRLVTDFYEYGYGEAFHFCPLEKGKPFDACLTDHDVRQGQHLEVGPGKKVVDMGCGVGGPARTMAKALGCDVIGLNISSYQLERCRLLTEKAGLRNKAAFIQGDFCNMPFKDNSLDGAYAFEATCHAPQLENVFGEAYRVLKPGSFIVVQDWFMTAKYDPSNKEHVRIKHAIEETNALPDLRMIPDGVAALKGAGFVDIEHYDMIEEGDEPWFNILMGRNYCSLASLRSSWFGRNMTHTLLVAMQAIGFVPGGTTTVHTLLLRAANELALGGKLGIFTPLYHLKARKPLA